jgi:hypothetical protein
VVQLEAKELGKDGILFMRFGAAMLWGNWDLSRLWDFSAMPLVLRFAIGNATEIDWSEVEVDLYSPAGWKAQPRQPLDWPKPEHLQDGCVTLELGRVNSGSRKVAPFWVKGPEGYSLGRKKDDFRSFHFPSQPGPGLNLAMAGVTCEEEVTFKAVLRARPAGGPEITRELEIPVKIHPANKS